MHLTRSEVIRKIPITRKGTKYVARALDHVNTSLPVVIAVRDVLGLAANTKEVQKMIHEKLLKINGRLVRDYRESLKLFNILEAGQKYRLNLLETGRFSLETTKDATRFAKVIGKRKVSKDEWQFNLHDGTNVQTKQSAKVGDSIELDMENKVKKIVSLEKGKEVLIISGRSIGKHGKIESIEDSNASIKIGEKIINLNKKHIFVI